jgi:hypothetical protein
LHRSDSVPILALCVHCGVAIEMNSAQPPVSAGHSDWIEPIVLAFDSLSARKQDINELIDGARAINRNLIAASRFNSPEQEIPVVDGSRS